MFEVERASLASQVQSSGCVGDVYLNEPLGIAIRLPAQWIVRDIQEVARAAEGRILSLDADGMNDVSRALTNQFLPIVTISAPPIDDPVARLGPHEICPVAVLQLESRVPGGAQAPFNLNAHVALDLSHMRRFVANFRVTAQPKVLDIFGSSGVMYSATYTMLNADAVGGCPTREHALYLRHDEYVLALRMCDYPRRDARLAFDFTEFIRSVVLR